MRTALRGFLVLGCLLFCASSVLADLPPPPGMKPGSPPPPVELKPVTPVMATLAEGATSEWLSTPRPIGVVEDLTALTGVSITGGLASWSTPVGTDLVRHVAGRTTGGDLHVFWWSGAGPRSLNITAKTGVRIASDPVAWLGIAPHEHIAAITPAGAIQVFDWTPAGDWTSASISAGSGKTFAGNLVTWTTAGTPPVEHVAGLTTSGEILIFYRRGTAAPFSHVDITAKTGVRASGLGGAWVTPDFREHLIVAGTDRKLYDLVWSSARDWTASPIALPEEVTGDVTAMGTWATEEIALRSTRDSLFHLSRNIGGTGAWTVRNHSQIDGEPVTGRPAFDTYATQIAVRGADGELLTFWPMSGNPNWQIVSLSDLVGMTASGTPAAWSTDVVVAAGTDGHLRAIRDFGEARRLTEKLLAPFMSLKSAFGRRKTVTILWNPETTDANCAAETGTGCLKPCDRTEIGNGVKLKFQKAAAVASMRQVEAYFRENSGGLLTVENVATLGWYTSAKPGAHYWQRHGAGACMDGWNPGDVEKWAEAIRMASADIDFVAFDTNGDRTLQADELAVVILIPQPLAPSGNYRSVVAENGAPLVVDGVIIPTITEGYVYSPEKAGSDFTDGVPDVGMIAHELSHHFFDHVDMYWGSRPPTAMAGHGIMDDGWAAAHHDPWAKLKFRWIRPRIIWHPARYTIKDVETRYTVRALLHPTRGTGEFLLFENRLRGTTFDKNLGADGLAIYHVMEDPAIYRRALPPFHWTDAQWATIGINDWGHRAIRMIRPVSTSGVVFDGGTSETYDSTWSVWRAGNTRTSYDLEPFPSTREHAWLRWGDGSHPGIAVRDVSAAGAEMKFTISAVSAANPSLCSAAGKNCGWIPDGFGGFAFCGDCPGYGACGGGGVPNVCGCTPRRCEDGYCGTVSDGCGGTITCNNICEEGFFCNRFHRCEQIPEPCQCGGRPPNCFPCPQEPLTKPAVKPKKKKQ